MAYIVGGFAALVALCFCSCNAEEVVTNSYAQLRNAINGAPTRSPTTIRLGNSFPISGELTFKPRTSITLYASDRRRITLDASGSGSRIFRITSGAEANIKNVVLKGGAATDGGAILVEDGGKLMIEECTFEDNVASTSGGAISNAGQIDKLEACSFRRNTASSWGGAVHNMGMIYSIENSVFEDNGADLYGQQGMEAVGGGAIANFGMLVGFSTCTLARNKAGKGSDSSGRGGALYNAIPTGKIRYVNECIFANNEASQSGHDIYNSDTLTGIFQSTFTTSNTLIPGITFANTAVDSLVYNNSFHGRSSSNSYLIKVIFSTDARQRRLYFYDNVYGRIDPVGGAQVCPGGTYLDKNMLDTIPFLPPDVNDWCISCKAGHYTDGLTECKMCPAGRQAPVGVGSATSCSVCLAGTYCPPGTQNALSCPECYYCPSAAAMLPCPTGMYCPENSANFQSCPEGHYCENIVDGECKSPESCPIGYLCTNGSGQAIECEAGSRATSDGSRCMPCPGGYYCPFRSTRGRFQTIPCPKSHACPPGSTVPLKCGDAMVPNARRTACEVCTNAEMINPDTGLCTPCPEGSIPTVGMSSCLLCSAGRYTSEDGLMCKGCPLGKHGNGEAGATSIDVCRSCPTGRYGGMFALPGLAYCPTCPEGRSGIKPGAVAVADGCKQDRVMYEIWVPVGILAGLLVNYGLYKSLKLLAKRKRDLLTTHVYEQLSVERGGRVNPVDYEGEERMDVLSAQCTNDEDELFRPFREILRDIEDLLVLAPSNLDFIRTIGHGPKASVKQVKVSLLAFGQAFISDTALKVLHASQVSTGMKLTNFVQHVTSLVRVASKEHIVDFYGVVWGRRAFPGLLMEYASKGNARDYIDSQKQMLEELGNQESLELPGFEDITILNIAIGITKGLIGLHSCSPPVSHGNLKLENVLLFPSKVKGAKHGIHAKLSEISGEKKIRGKVNMNDTVPADRIHCAPENFQGEPFNQVSDIYTLGLVLNELDSGKAPYSHLNKATSARAVDSRGVMASALQKSEIVNDHVRPLIRPGMDSKLRKTIRKCWKYDLLCTERTNRGDTTYGRPSAEDILEVLLDCRDSIPIASMKHV